MYGIYVFGFISLCVISNKSYTLRCFSNVVFNKRKMYKM